MRVSDEQPILRGGIATGVGSWPGVDPREAAATIVGELSDLPHLVELPGRGTGSDMIGRSSALLIDLRFDTTTRGYRLAPRPGSVSRRAHDLLRTDLDALEEAWETAGLGDSGRAIKVQATGPLTLAAQVELSGGHRILTDSGAVRDLSESLAEGVSRHAAEVARRLGANVVVQLDEPSLTDVLNGSLKGTSLLDTVPALPGPEALHILDTVIAAQSAPVLVHSCAGAPPLEFLRGSAAAAIGFDLATIATSDLDAVGELLDGGKFLALGLVPTKAPATPPTWRAVAEPAVRLIDRLGFRRRTLAERILISPACGLSTAPLSWARRSLSLATDVARAFGEEPEELSFAD
ncbi:methionine synthase [Nocardia pseudobrasiliensis]|uniref:Cobalamin-independent methionine synthase catalytic subunit n=1 Tax=Nocardia pseudobrasiliensis TaxID=45979 RepID=A0A370IF11_9NOCA|nr:methionine synthase [Nocardia pseudobrasiliensis]RDI69307.1 cobalamin-independent methionine synthase catalytic subunit [Nocardia pseudobrasiliensis]